MNDQRKGMKKCPTELKDYIFDIAGPLTKWLNGRMELSSEFNKRLIRRDAIQIGWKGDYGVVFECDGYACVNEIADILINQSKEFHEWLFDQLRSKAKTKKIVDKMQALHWVQWWKDSIANLDSSELKKQFGRDIGSYHIEMVRYLMTSEEYKMRMLMGTEDDDRCFVETFLYHSQKLTSLSDEVFYKPARSNILWTILHNVTINGSNCAMDAAAKIGDIEIIKWIHGNIGDSCTTTAMRWAAANGDLKIVKWLHEKRTEGCTTDAMDCAAENGHLEVVKWLHEYRAEGCTTDAMDKAAHNGHLEVVKWLHENRNEGCTADAMDLAAANGHLDVVIWLQKNRTEGCTKKAMLLAKAYGHLEVVKWLFENINELDMR